MKRFISFFLVFFLVSIGLVSASNYADIEINTFSNGDLTINGLTNYDGFETFQASDYLTQKGRYWILNITTNTVFDNAVYAITLPEDTTVNYMKLPSLITISSKNNKITILGMATNQTLNILVQYSTKNNVVNYVWLIIILIVLFGGFGLFKYLKILNRKNVVFNYDNITDRQKQIVKIVLANPKGITQAKVEKLVDMPKSSLSRNIDSLVRKNIIRKEQVGIMNKLYIITSKDGVKKE